MDSHYPPPDFAASIYEGVFEVAREKVGDGLHDIVNSRATFVDDDVLRVLQAVVSWKTEKGIPLNRPDAMVAANASLHMAVNSSGFRKYFETPAGDDWFHIRDILSLGDDVSAATAFTNVLELFPDCEPSRFTASRQDQIDLIDETHPDIDVFNSHDRIRHPMNYPSDDTLFKSLLALPDQPYLPPPNMR
ncbi:DMP19 family protein [Novipirellula caenicola]|uniref:DNA mimic protein DMP19 C-terminal domain-containing protein n=1 Tax=Novipirellula caenicola TaxID=1536901 RepID=A0ABP9VJ86_9BACT